MTACIADDQTSCTHEWHYQKMVCAMWHLSSGFEVTSMIVKHMSEHMQEWSESICWGDDLVYWSGLLAYNQSSSWTSFATLGN